MNTEVLYLIGAIGFQCSDTITTFMAVKEGAIEFNKLFKFLNEGKARHFILVGTIKAFFPVLVYLLTTPQFGIILLLYDLFLEAGVTLWNILVIAHGVGR